MGYDRYTYNESVRSVSTPRWYQKNYEDIVMIFSKINEIEKKSDENIRLYCLLINRFFKKFMS